VWTSEHETINENLRQALAAFSYISQEGEVATAPGVDFTFSATPFPLFNTGLVTASVPGAAGRFEDILDSAGAFFDRRSAPWSLWFCEDLLTREESRRAKLLMATRSMRRMMEAPGMIAGELTPFDRPASLGIERVAEQRTRSDFSAIMSQAFLVPLDVSRQVYGGERLWTSRIRGWVGYVDGVAISTAACVAGGEAIGVYAVATAPKYQRKGYGESTMRHAIEQTQRETGLRRSVLQSSAAGHSLYLRMGYRAITRYLAYAKA